MFVLSVRLFFQARRHEEDPNTPKLSMGSSLGVGMGVRVWQLPLDSQRKTQRINLPRRNPKKLRVRKIIAKEAVGIDAESR